jgi:hypothetical protein
MSDHLKNVPTETVEHDDVSITFPESIKNPINRDWLGPSLEKLAEGLSTDHYENAKLPFPLREGKEPLNDPERLIQGLTPAGQFLAENLTDATTTHISDFAREAIGTGSPLKLTIEIGSFNIFSAQQESTIPPLLDYLFLKQVHDYLAVLKNYPHGLDLKFQFDPTGDQWVYGKIIGEQAIELAQAQHEKAILKLIKTNFPESEFPRIQVNSLPMEDLDQALKAYQDIEKVVQNNEREFFTSHPQAHNWQYLHQHIRDQNETIPEYSNEQFADFHISLDKFVSNYIDQIDPDRTLGIFRATSQQLNKIGSELQWRIKPQILESPNDEFPYSGWLKPQKIIELTRRFIAREIWHNQTVANNTSELHLRSGDPGIHKQFYRRPGIALKLSGVQIPAIPTLEIPRLFIGQSKQAKLEITHDTTTLQSQEVQIDFNGNQFTIPIGFHSTITR